MLESGVGMLRSGVIVFAVYLSGAFACRHAGPSTESEATASGSLPSDAPPMVLPVADAAPPVDSPQSDASSPALPEAFRIVSIVPDGSGTMITINKGSVDGVDDSWHGHLIDDVGQRVHGGDLTIVKVEQRTTRARVALPPDVVRAYRSVKMDWR